MRLVDAVVFDFGGVLTEPVLPFVDRVVVPGLDRFAVRDLLLGDSGNIDSDHAWHRLERGEITLHEYALLTRRAAARLGIHNFEIPFAALSGDVSPSPRPCMVDLARRVRKAGLATAIITNNIRERRDWRAMLDAEHLVHLIVDSCEVGMRKPDRRIFDYTVERLGVSAARTVFLDDLAANAEGAERAGLIGVHVCADGQQAITSVEYLAGIREGEHVRTDGLSRLLRAPHVEPFSGVVATGSLQRVATGFAHAAER
jgi:putative hydrolase of the HAD superfamily